MCQLTSNAFNQIPAPTLPVPTFDSKRKSSGRLKFWEVQRTYHCAALGTCLTLKELRTIAKKVGVDEISTWADYDMHVSFVHSLDEKSHLSIMVNKLLDKKFKLTIMQFSKTKSEKERILLWNKATKTGDIAGAFWAMITHPDSTENTLFQVYGKVHMLSHLSGAAARIDMREFHRLEQRNEKLSKQIENSDTKSNKKIEKLESQLKQYKAQTSELIITNNELEANKKELDEIKNTPLVADLQAQLNRQNKELEIAIINSKHAEEAEEKWKLRAIREQQEKQDTLVLLENLKIEKMSLENIASGLLGKKDELENCASCPNSNPDLCGRCVLYIGGRSSQYSHFRQLVEQQNGTFIHHDGGREDGIQQLASIVSKADVVLCPLDCVSHNAMNTVKRHCQNNTKQLVFIPHASLSAFSKGLGEVI